MGTSMLQIENSPGSGPIANKDGSPGTGDSPPDSAPSSEAVVSEGRVSSEAVVSEGRPSFEAVISEGRVSSEAVISEGRASFDAVSSDSASLSEEIPSGVPPVLRPRSASLSAILPQEMPLSSDPRQLLWRWIAVLGIVVGVPSIVFNLLLDSPQSMDAVEGQVVVVVSFFIGLLWLSLFVYFLGLYRRSWRTEPRFAIVLGVLTLDALRNFLESAYFGIAYSGWIRLIPNHIMRLLWQPQVMILSRLLSLATALIIVWLVLEGGFFNLKLREQRSLLLEQRNRELTSLQQMASLLSGTLEIRTILNDICQEIVETLAFKSALLCLVDENGGVVRGEAGYGVPQSLIDETVRELEGPDILSDIVRTGATEVITGWDQRFHRETYERYKHGQQVRVFAPIADARGIVGVVDATVLPDSLPPDEHRLALLHSFLRHACTAIRNARLHERVLRDRERLNLLTRSLEDKNKQLEGFVYMISHDLKAPLVSIQGFLTLMDTECRQDMGEDGQFYLHRVRSNAEHLQGLIGQLLELSRIGRIEDHRCWIDLEAMLADVIGAMKPRLEEAGIELEMAQPLSRVFAGQTQLRQLLVNLIDNSIKYMGNGASRRIRIEAKEASGGTKIIISDTGIGTPPDLREKVFQMFQRAPVPGQSVEGSGVGLAIVRKIAETHGGTAWMSDPDWGYGIAVHVFLPAQSYDAQ